MRQRRLHGRFVSLGLGVVFALLLAMPTGVAADTTPTPVAVGASVTFTGTGFAPNEFLSIWETDANSVSTPLAGIQSDGSGGFTTTVTFPSAGAWTATAHSINTQKEFVGNYAVGTTSGATTAPAPGSPLVPPVGASPTGATSATGTPVGVGAFTTFSGSGFNANEAISMWETPPEGSATTTPTALPGIQADSTGAFTTSVEFPSAGQWQVTAHGLVSGHEIIAPFAVGITGATGAVSSPINGTGTGVLPVTTAPINGPGFNGIAATIGAPVTFTGSGFTGNEQIALWTTAPDSTTAALSSTQATGTGTFAVSVIFPSAGNWQVTAHGHDSAHQVIGRYSVTDSSSSAATSPLPSPASTFVSPSAGVPVKATAGTTVTYTATGFTAGETVSAWVTPPDSTTVTQLDQVQASSTGQAAVSTSFGTAGLWQITLHGLTSGHEVVGKYQVSAQA